MIIYDLNCLSKEDLRITLRGVFDFLLKEVKENTDKKEIGKFVFGTIVNNSVGCEYEICIRNKHCPKIRWVEGLYIEEILSMLEEVKIDYIEEEAEEIYNGLKKYFKRSLDDSKKYLRYELDINKDDKEYLKRTLMLALSNLAMYKKTHNKNEGNIDIVRIPEEDNMKMILETKNPNMLISWGEDEYIEEILETLKRIKVINGLRECEFKSYELLKEQFTNTLERVKKKSSK